MGAVQLLCYVQELNACIVFQKLCRFAHFATFRYKLIRLFCKRESFPVRLLNCQSGPNRCHVVLRYFIIVVIFVVYRSTNFAWAVWEEWHDKIFFFFLKFKQPSYLVSVLRAILSLISSAFRLISQRFFTFALGVFDLFFAFFLSFFLFFFFSHFFYLPLVTPFPNNNVRYSPPFLFSLK